MHSITVYILQNKIALVAEISFKGLIKSVTEDLFYTKPRFLIYRPKSCTFPGLYLWAAYLIPTEF